MFLLPFKSPPASPRDSGNFTEIIHRHDRVPVLAVMPYWLGPAEFESRVIVVVVFLGAVVEFQGRVAVRRPSAPAHQHVAACDKCRTRKARSKHR